MIESPLVSVCIRGWNRPERLRRAIRSVLAQSLENLEIVVADDFGGLSSVVESFNDPRLRYYRNETRLGSTENGRRVLNLARGDLRVVLGDDDELRPGFFAATLPIFERQAHVGVVFTNSASPTPQGLVLRQRPIASGLVADPVLNLLRLPSLVTLSAAIVRRSVWEEGEKRQALSPRAGVDVQLFLRAAQDGWGFWYVDEPLGLSGVSCDQVSSRPEIMAEFGVATWELFSFRTPEHENLRRHHLAAGLLYRAGYRLRLGADGVCSDLDQAESLLGKLPLRGRIFRVLNQCRWLVKPAGWAKKFEDPLAPILSGLRQKCRGRF